MPNEHISLDDIYRNPVAEGSIFRAVKMMAEEARFINEQAKLGYIDLTEKPTTIAMRQFKQNRIAIVPPEEMQEEQADEVDEALIPAEDSPAEEA